MSYNARHERIIALLRALRHVTVSDLASRLQVSEVTIRKDLTLLAERGKVHRSHGGATLAQDVDPIPPVEHRSDERQAAKDRIAQTVGAMVSEGEVVAIDAGSTTLAVASYLTHRLVRVVTNSLPIAHMLAPAPEPTLTVIGGSLRPEAGALIGPIAEAAIGGLRMDVAIVGVTAFTADGTFYCRNQIEGQAKRRFLEQARRRVVVADATKYEARAFARFADAHLVDLLVVDTMFEGIDQVRAAGVEVVVAAVSKYDSGI